MSWCCEQEKTTVLKASERHCSKVNHSDPRQEKSNNSKEVFPLVISILETQIMNFVYKNEAIIY